MKSLVAPGNVVNLEFLNIREGDKQPQRCRQPMVIDRTRIQSYSQAKYEFMMGLESQPTNNCLNNFVTSMPRKTTARRPSVPEIESIKRGTESSKLSKIG